VIARYFVIFSLEADIRLFTPGSVRTLLGHSEFTIRSEDKFSFWAVGHRKVTLIAVTCWKRFGPSICHQNFTNFCWQKLRAETNNC
jgi:hypothetical protein